MSSLISRPGDCTFKDFVVIRALRHSCNHLTLAPTVGGLFVLVRVDARDQADLNFVIRQLFIDDTNVTLINSRFNSDPGYWFWESFKLISLIYFGHFVESKHVDLSKYEI